MKKYFKILLITIIAAFAAIQVHAQAVDMAIDNPGLTPAPASFPGTVTLSFSFYAELGSHVLSADDVDANFAYITIGLSKLDGTGIQPTGAGADLFVWTYNAATKQFTGKSKAVTVVEDVIYDITFSNVPLTESSTINDIGFNANLTPPGDLLASESNDDNTARFTSAFIAVVPPVATPNTASTTPATLVTIDILTDDSPGSAPLNVTSVLLIDPNNGNAKVTTLTIPGEGTYVVNTTTGAVDFTPVAGFTGVTTPVKYTVKDNNGTESNEATITVTVGPLPVTLISFDAAKEGKTTHLNWATTEETNSDRFEVEHSVNGKNWNKIGAVKSNSESTTLKKYSYVDVKPLNGENLYRLRMVDNDGTFAYSNIRGVKFEGIVNQTEIKITVYPNPTSDRVFLKDADVSQIEKISIVDANGHAVYSSKSVSEKGINVSNLSAGMYVLRVKNLDGTSNNHKLLINR